MNTNIEKAIEDLSAGSRRYARYERYYRGVHELLCTKIQKAFGSPFANLREPCPAVRS